MLMASSPDEHWRLTAIVGVSSGIPAFRDERRAAYPASAAWSALPMTTSSTMSGEMLARSRAALIAAAPRSGAATSLNDPPNLPIGVLAPLMITAFSIAFLLAEPAVSGFAPIIRYSRPLPIRAGARSMSSTLQWARLVYFDIFPFI